jgi:predicted Zn-dependent protease
VNRRSGTRPARRGAALIAGVLLAACATNPATGRRQLSLVSEAQEIQMGREADQQVSASIGLYPEASLQSYVQRVGAGLAASSERPTLQWTFRVVDDPTVNAMSKAQLLNVGLMVGMILRPQLQNFGGLAPACGSAWSFPRGGSPATRSRPSAR